MARDSRAINRKSETLNLDTLRRYAMAVDAAEIEIKRLKGELHKAEEEISKLSQVRLEKQEDLRQKIVVARGMCNVPAICQLLDQALEILEGK